MVVLGGEAVSYERGTPVVGWRRIRGVAEGGVFLVSDTPPLSASFSLFLSVSLSRSLSLTHR